MSGGIWAGYISILILAGLIVSYFFVTAPQRRMRRFLKELANVEVGKSNIADWRRQVKAANLPRESLLCDGGNCTISQKAQVRSISRLRLAPPSSMTASVSFQNGIASEIYVWLEIDNQKTAGATQPGAGATIHETLESRSCPLHYCTYITDRSGHPWAVVEMDSAASAEERAKAFTLNIGCLTKFGGCKTARAMLPSVFGKS